MKAAKEHHILWKRDLVNFSTVKKHSSNLFSLNFRIGLIPGMAENTNYPQSHEVHYYFQPEDGQDNLLQEFNMIDSQSSFQVPKIEYIGNLK